MNWSDTPIRWRLFYLFLAFGAISMYVSFLERDTPTPDLYELTRQTATSSRHTVWLLIIGLIAWLIRDTQPKRND